MQSLVFQGADPTPTDRGMGINRCPSFLTFKLKWFEDFVNISKTSGPHTVPNICVGGKRVAGLNEVHSLPNHLKEAPSGTIFKRLNKKIYYYHKITAVCENDTT